MADPRVTVPIRPNQPEDFYLPADVPTPVPASQADNYIRGLVELNQQLADRFRREKMILPFDVVSQEQSDSSGNVTFVIYQVGAGFYASVNRLVIEAATYTPAAPFSGGSLYIYKSSTPGPLAPGQLCDFLPTVAGGQLCPAVAQYVNGGDPQDTGGVFLRSQDYLMCQIVSGPTSKLISVHTTGVLWGAES